MELRALIENWKERLSKCAGYPVCDGDLPGEEHTPACPEYNRFYKPISVTECIKELEASLAPPPVEESPKYYPLPWAAPNDEPEGAYCMDANGVQVLMFYWPTHPIEETRAVELETYELMRLIPRLVNEHFRAAQQSKSLQKGEPEPKSIS